MNNGIDIQEYHNGTNGINGGGHIKTKNNQDDGDGSELSQTSDIEMEDDGGEGIEEEEKTNNN